MCLNCQLFVFEGKKLFHIIRPFFASGKAQTEKGQMNYKSKGFLRVHRVFLSGLCRYAQQKIPHTLQGTFVSQVFYELRNSFRHTRSFCPCEIRSAVTGKPSSSAMQMLSADIVYAARR
jgi:hypothetical protein